MPLQAGLYIEFLKDSIVVTAYATTEKHAHPVQQIVVTALLLHQEMEVLEEEEAVVAEAVEAVEAVVAKQAVFKKQTF